MKTKSPSLLPQASPASCGAGRAAATPAKGAQVRGAEGMRPPQPAAAPGPRPAADPGLPLGRGAAGAFASAAAVRVRSESSPPLSAAGTRPRSAGRRWPGVTPPPCTPRPGGEPRRAALPPPGQRRRPGRFPLPGRPGLPARRSSSIAAASCSASRHSSATGAAAPGCPQRSPELSALSKDSAERRVMGGGGGRGPARPQVGGCRQERAPLRRRGAQRRAGRMVPAPGPGAACERRESVVSGEPRERRSRRRARFWRSRFGTSQHPEEGSEARDHLPAERGRDISSPPPPSLSSAPLRRGLGGGGVPRRWSRFVANANPLMPRSLG